MTSILKLLEEDARYTAKELADMTGKSEAEVREIVEKLEKDHVINGYTALIDWDRTDVETVTAFIEVKITPQRDDGFDRIAERIYQYDEVESLYLMSGAFDFAVIVEGRTLKEVSQFVSLKLAPIEGVISTATHFIMKRYKDNHIMFKSETEQEERVLFV
ncbi:MAG: Lrp/AsnC family transcriptional regulator [Oscillospiraceae bacterium]|nr:Lrp/AsnC family transcriptional regulator [Oscillospiraceae bacterium]